MRVLVCHTRLGPTAVFTPPARGALPASARVPGADRIVAPAFTQVASRGPQSGWDAHCRVLASCPPYAGRWTVEDVPDGLTAAQALSRVRRDAAARALA